MTTKRIKTIQQQLAADAALLITSPANRQYLTGFISSAGAVLITAGGARFYTDSRYIEKARATVTGCAVCLSRNMQAEIGQQMAADRIRTLYVETETMSVSALAGWRQALPSVTVSDNDRYDKLLADMRQEKDADELACIRQAQKITDETFTYILDHIRPGRSEREIMLDMEFYMRRLGSEGVAFDFIVVSGCNSSMPHGVPTDKLVEKGDFVTMDFGAVVDGYCSDMTRTVAVGEISDRQRLVYDTVLQAQTLALAGIRPGAVCRDIDALARQHIDAAGFGSCFGHGLGHSLGLEVHESPAFSPRCETVLTPGMVMTVEPGIYLEGEFGVRIEDMVVVTDNGYEDLTASEKKLILL